jgi:hypothetical protein
VQEKVTNLAILTYCDSLDGKRLCIIHELLEIDNNGILILLEVSPNPSHKVENHMSLIIFLNHTIQM